MVQEIGRFCREFRKNVLHMTLKEVSNNDFSVKNLSAFENGRANKIEYILLYYNACITDDMRDRYIKGVLSGGKC